jgi:hypothetical protein
MAELVDAPDSKSGSRKAVGVRVPLPACILSYRLRGTTSAVWPNARGSHAQSRVAEILLARDVVAGKNCAGLVADATRPGTPARVVVARGGAAEVAEHPARDASRSNAERHSW